jgi:UTP--glucose-1-phosphate uridylyltransferase
MSHLRRVAEPQLIREMELFYERVRSSGITFINQPEPMGFGDAVLRGKNFTNRNPFVVHAGDDLILSRKIGGSISRLITTFEAYKADAAFFVQKVKDPSKYGVVEGYKSGRGLYRIRHVEEKPRRPKSKMAIIALYVFNERIYPCIAKARQRRPRELELTDAIEHLILDGGRVYALELEAQETRVDVGSPESYWNALRTTANGAFRP